MEKNKRKSRALIITFFIMIILLFLFYILFIKNNPLENTKGTSNENRNFFSLFSKSKDKELNTLDENNKNQNITENNTGDSGSDEEIVTGINIGGNSDDDTNQIPLENNKLRPIPTPEDDFIDAETEILKNPDIKTFPEIEIENVKQCNLDDYKLKFTDAEKAELEKLLREFYKFASSVKTEEDIDIEHEAKQSYIDLVAEAKDLTKQCYLETSSPTYLANFDFNNSINDQENTPNGTWISKNYSRLSEARIERKVNPWYIFSNSNEGYSYRATILGRSDRLKTSVLLFSNGITYFGDNKVSDVKDGISNTNPTPLSDSVIAESECIRHSKNYITSISNSIPSNYRIDANCAIIDGPVLPVGDNKNNGSDSIGVYFGIVWYPKKPGYSQEDYYYREKEWFYYESTCEKRAGVGNCVQPTAFSYRAPLKRVEWIYSVDVVSPKFNSLEECQKAMSANGHKGTCTGESSTNAYIQKLWNQELLTDGSVDIYGYVPPIDYYLFEQMFNIW